VQKTDKAQTKIRKIDPENMRDITLIALRELSEIHRIWLEERHEFDDSLPRIYQEVTGEQFIDKVKQLTWAEMKYQAKDASDTEAQ
jgi:DNA sulfur modification protein DndC